MRRLLPILALLCLASTAHATAAFVQQKTGTGTSLTLTSATTIGDSFGVGVSSSTANTATVKIGTQTLSLDGQCAPLVAGNFTCIYATASLTVASTAVSCTGCGTGNAIGAVEYSGTNGVEPVVGCFFTSTTLCQLNVAGAAVGIRYQPGYSSEGVFFIGTCGGSSTAPTVNNLTGGGNAIPNGNPIAWGISSGTAVTSMVPSSGCPGGTGAALIGMAFTGTGATQQPVANPNMQDYSAECTSGACTVSAFVFNVGDIVAVDIWGLNGNSVTTLTLGSQTITCPAGTQGTTNANAGRPWICYAIATAAGSQTISFTPSGSPTDYQVAYQDFTVSANTTPSFDKGATANCVASCSEGTTVATPSITPTNTGSLLISFVATQSHAVAPAGSWSCYAYIATGETQDCTMITTKNVASWILNSAAGSTSANTTILNTNDPFQSIIAAFSLSAPAGATAIPRRRFGVF